MTLMSPDDGMHTEQRVSLSDGRTIACLAFGAPGGSATCVNGAYACDAFHRWSWRQPLRYSHRNHRKLLVVDDKVACVGWMMRRWL